MLKNTCSNFAMNMQWWMIQHGLLSVSLLPPEIFPSRTGTVSIVSASHCPYRNWISYTWSMDTLLASLNDLNMCLYPASPESLSVSLPVCTCTSAPPSQHQQRAFVAVSLSISILDVSICLSVNVFVFFTSSFYLILLNSKILFVSILFVIVDPLSVSCSFLLCVIFCLSLFCLVFLHPLIGKVDLSVTNMESFLPPCGHVCLADMFINGCWGEVLGVTFGLPRSLRFLVFIVYVSSTQNL